VLDLNRKWTQKLICRIRQAFDVSKKSDLKYVTEENMNRNPMAR